MNNNVTFFPAMQMHNNNHAAFNLALQAAHESTGALSINGQNFSYSQWDAIFTAISNNQDITEINLSNNALTDEQLELFLANNIVRPPLLNLNLANNNITDAGMQLIAEDLSMFDYTDENWNLILDLEGNQIIGDQIGDLVERPMLIIVNLENNNLTTAALHEIVEAITEYVDVDGEPLYNHEHGIRVYLAGNVNINIDAVDYEMLPGNSMIIVDSPEPDGGLNTDEESSNDDVPGPDGGLNTDEEESNNDDAPNGGYTYSPSF